MWNRAYNRRNRRTVAGLPATHAGKRLLALSTCASLGQQPAPGGLAGRNTCSGTPTCSKHLCLAGPTVGANVSPRPRNVSFALVCIRQVRHQGYEARGGGLPYETTCDMTTQAVVFFSEAAPAGRGFLDGVVHTSLSTPAPKWS